MKNPVKEKLARGEVVASMTVRLVSGIEIVPIAKAAGFDSLYIDLEHSSLTLHAASQISIMALEAGIPALVRVPAGSRGLVAGLPHFGFRSIPAAEALPALNEATLVMVQCESAASLEATEEIVAIDGIDMVMIGSNDLLADLGLAGQYDHPKLAQAYER